MALQFRPLFAVLPHRLPGGPRADRHKLWYERTVREPLAEFVARAWVFPARLFVTGVGVRLLHVPERNFFAGHAGVLLARPLRVLVALRLLLPRCTRLE